MCPAGSNSSTACSLRWRLYRNEESRPRNKQMPAIKSGTQRGRDPGWDCNNLKTRKIQARATPAVRCT
jgi:hypothetical protein